MDKVLSTTSYGICIFSFDVLQNFLKNEKIRSKKLLALFQRDQEKYLLSQEAGVWIPIPKIDSIDYVIKLDSYDNAFDDEWAEKFVYEGFNLEIKDGLWISSIGSFLTFEKDEYLGKEGMYKTPYGILHHFSSKERSYQTLDGITQYTDYKYDVPEGKYLLSIKGYVRKQQLVDMYKVKLKQSSSISILLSVKLSVPSVIFS